MLASRAASRLLIPSTEFSGPSIFLISFAADFLVDHGDKARARQFAERCLQRLRAQDFGREGKEWIELARHVVEQTR